MARYRPKTRAQKWTDGKIAQGLCGDCGVGKIAFPRSKRRCHDCLDRAQALRVDNAVRTSSLFHRSA
jgi:hypothetical protein